MKLIRCDRPGGCPRTEHGVAEDQGKKWFVVTNVVQLDAAARGQAPPEVRHFCSSECLTEWARTQAQAEAWGPKQ